MALKWSLFFFFVSILQYVFPIVHDEIQLNFKNSKDCNFYCDKKVNNQNFPCIFKHCNNDNKESNTTDLLYRNWLEPGLCLEIHHKKDWKSNVDFCEKIAKIIAKPDDSPTSDKDNIIDSPKNIADKVDGESPGSAKPDDSPTSDKDNSKDSSKKIADKVDGESPGSGNHEPKTKITTKGIESKSTNLKSIPEQQQKEVNSKLDKDHDESHFFIYFFVISLLLLLFYFVIYNKKKVMALFIEGRRKRGRYKPLPKKVDFTLEEAMASESLVSSNNSFPY